MYAIRSYYANIIVADFANTTMQELNYYFSLPPRFLGSLDYELRLSVHYLQRLNEFSRRSGDSELSERIENALTNSYNFV